MEHLQVQQEIELGENSHLPFAEHVGWRVRTAALPGEEPSPWTSIDMEEYERCKGREGYEFDKLYSIAKPQASLKFEALVTIAAVHVSKFPDGRYWVAVHPPKQGNLWWHECSLSLAECINLCYEKAVKFGLLRGIYL